MSKHTPGPWAQRAYRLDEIVAIGRDRNSLESIAAVERLLGRHDEAKANASLIAAAPDLLEALRVLIECRTYGPVNYEADAWILASDAIAKATGEAS